jgi:hypothetical protein
MSQIIEDPRFDNPEMERKNRYRSHMAAHARSVLRGKADFYKGTRRTFIDSYYVKLLLNVQIRLQKGPPIFSECDREPVVCRQIASIVRWQREE